LKVNVIYNDDGKTDQIEFEGGCYESDEIGLYEEAKPNRTYSLNYIPFEVRHQ